MEKPECELQIIKDLNDKIDTCLQGVLLNRPSGVILKLSDDEWIVKAEGLTI